MISYTPHVYTKTTLIWFFIWSDTHALVQIDKQVRQIKLALMIILISIIWQYFYNLAKMRIANSFSRLEESCSGFEEVKGIYSLEHLIGIRKG